MALEMAVEMSAQGGVKPSQVAEKLGIDRSSAYRLLYTLMMKGYLQQDPSSHQFLPNPSKFFALSSEVAGPMNWPIVANGFLRVLRDRTGETANLGILEGGEIVYIGQQAAHEALTVRVQLGTRRPLHCSALGKAILAHLPEIEIDHLIGNQELPAYTPQTITSPQKLKDHLKTVRELGYAVDDEETFQEVRCIAAPIYDHRRQVVASMGISGPYSRIKKDRLHLLAHTVIEVAVETSIALGARQAWFDGHEARLTANSDQNLPSSHLFQS